MRWRGMNEEELQRHLFLSWALDAGQWIASHPATLPTDAHCTAGWEGPRAGVDVLGEKKNHLPQPGIERFLGYPACRQVTIQHLHNTDGDNTVHSRHWWGSGKLPVKIIFW